MKRLVSILLSLAICAGLFTACAGSSSPSDQPTAQAGVSEDVNADGGSGGLDESAIMNDLKPQDERKIIYTASLTLESKEYEKTLQSLLEAAAKAGAYVEQSEEGGNAEHGSRWVQYTFRVPSQNYRTFLNEADGAGSVVSKSESTQDVTTEYVDVQARLDSLGKQEQRLLELAGQAGSLEDLLTIEKELTDVRYEIESYTGQKRVMDSQISYSTVNIYLSEVQILTPTANRFSTRLTTAMQDSWQGFVKSLQNILIGIVYFLPHLLLLALIAGVVIIVIRAVQKKQSKKPKQTPQIPRMENPVTDGEKKEPIYEKKE